MSSERKIVGFDRKVELPWLDATAAQVAHGATADELHAFLWKLLEGSVSAGSSGFNSDRGKTVTVLKRIWCLVPGDVGDLRDRAIKALWEADATERIAIHWAMCISTYPFFRDVASTIGRLMALQEQVTLTEVRRRLVEQWGDRDITKRASQRIIRSFVAWGVLRDASPRGTYQPPTSKILVAGRTGELMVEALLLSLERPLPSTQVVTYPALFPFQLELSPADLRRSPKFVLDRQGVDTDMVRLADA